MNWFKSFWDKLAAPESKEKPMSLQTGSNFKSYVKGVLASFEPPGNLTPHAQQVLALARKEAVRLNHSFLGTEHLLLGILALGQGVAVAVLKKMGLQLDTMRLEIQKQVGGGPDRKPSVDVPYTPLVKKVLTLAASEAAALNHTHVGTEHILLGLLTEGEGVAARVLKHFGLNVDKTREKVLEQLDPNYRPAPAPAAGSPATTGLTSPRLPSPASAISTKPPEDVIDTGKLYDVYCVERNQEIVVYRNAIIKGLKSLAKGAKADAPPEFLEIQQADGRAVFIPRSCIIKFCEHGVTPRSESAPGRQT